MTKLSIIPSTSIIVVIGLTLILLFSHCEKERSSIPNILYTVDSIKDLYPDSALSILNIVNEDDLTVEDYNKYFLSLVECKTKANIDISHDTVIYQVYKYYKSQKDLINTVYAAYYAGRVKFINGDRRNAMKYYLEAKSLASNTDDNRIKGIIEGGIGRSLYYDLSFKESILHWKEAVGFFTKVDDYKNIVLSNNFIGTCFLNKGMDDSAMVYFELALKESELYNLAELNPIIKLSMAYGYQIKENYSSAKNIYYEVLESTKDLKYQSKYYLNLAKIFVVEQKKDSAQIYINLAKKYLDEVSDFHLKASLYSSISTLSANSKDYESAYNNLLHYTNLRSQIEQKDQSQNILKVQKKYDFQKVQREKDLLLIFKQRVTLIFMASLIVMMLISLFFIFRIRKSKQLAREKRLQKEQNEYIAQMEAENRLSEYNEMAIRYQKEKDAFKQFLLNHFNVLSNVAMLEQELSTPKGRRLQGEDLLKKVNDIVYQKRGSWEALYEIMNKEKNGFFDFFKEQYPQLDEMQFRICCLYFMELGNNEISIITNQSITMVYKKKTETRSKLHLQRTQDLNIFLQDLYQKFLSLD